MKRLLKWLLPALILVEVALVWFGILDLGEAVLIVAGIEVLIFFTAIGEIVLVVKSYRKNRASGLDFWSALEGGLAVLLPRPVAKLVTTEPRLFYYLTKWVLRKTKPGAGEFTYHKRSTLDMFVLMIVLVSPVEILVIEVLLQAFLPLLWLRLLVLFLEVYGLFWFLGFYASRVALPYRLEEEGIRVRHGVFAEGFIPYYAIENVERTRKKAPRSGDGLTVDGREAFLAIGGHTDATLELRAPRRLNGFLRATDPVNVVYLAADKPEQLLKGLEERVAKTLLRFPEKEITNQGNL